MREISWIPVLGFVALMEAFLSSPPLPPVYSQPTLDCADEDEQEPESRPLSDLQIMRR